MKPSDLPAPLEAVEQAAFIVWCGIETNRIKYPGLYLIHCSLNGVKLTKKQANDAKDAGMLAGIPDLFLPVVQWHNQLTTLKIHAGLFIEMKRIKGSVHQLRQKEIKGRLEMQGYKVVVFKGCDEAIQAVKDYYA